MSLPPEFIQSIRKDVQLILQLLRRRRKSYSLDNPEELGRDIYNYYHSHSRETITEELMLVKGKLRETMIELNSFGSFKSEFDREKDAYVRFYSWDPKDNPEESIIDSCTVRIYLNPKLGHFKDVIVDLMRFYSRMPSTRKAPLMFKIPFWANLQPIMVEKSDKIVIYANPKNRLIERLVARIKNYPNDYFNDAIPLFTHRIRNGVGRAYEPKEENVFVRALRRITGKENLYLSYGQHISFLIARGIQMAVVNEGIRRKGQTFEFNTLEDHLIAKIGTRTMVFVLKRCKEDLDL
ncbi:hypothetical protein COV12_00030 [Candidatus Woesearchaeota archaeon CG10_big_fil_rev_8_21_14_0_10_32_24]|nr:MAG: hypothetical protein COV12_00030 [Candidatus Woesearchaeota archaeon CG10_big_fil_rev_8_21_14_0_10_32_24]